MLVGSNRLIVFALIEIDIANTPQGVEIVGVKLQDMSVGVRRLGVIGSIECPCPEAYISVFIPRGNVAGICRGFSTQIHDELARLLGELYSWMARGKLTRILQ